MATITIEMKNSLREPSSDQEVTVATLTLTIDSGGSLEADVIVTVTAKNETASM